MSQSRGPRDEVFTTAVVNSEGRVADGPAHLKRMKNHAKRLRIALPDEFPAMELEGSEMGLVRLSYSSENLSLIHI